MKSRKTTGRKPRTTKTVSATSKRKPSAGLSGKKRAGAGKKPKTSPLEDALAFQIKNAGLPPPVRESTFHETRKWRFDFSWEEAMVAVEVEGGLHMGGRHNRAAGMIADMCKYNAAALLGWTVLRVASSHIKDGQAIEWIEEALESYVQGRDGR